MMFRQSQEKTAPTARTASWMGSSTETTTIVNSTRAAVQMKLNTGCSTFCHSHVAAAATARKAAANAEKIGRKTLFHAHDAAVWMPDHTACTPVRNHAKRL